MQRIDSTDSLRCGTAALDEACLLAAEELEDALCASEEEPDCSAEEDTTMHTTTATELNDALSRGFSAGNSDAVYVSEDYAKARAWRRAESKDTLTQEYEWAYVVGFFSSYEEHEIPELWRQPHANALAIVGPHMKRLGIAVR